MKLLLNILLLTKIITNERYHPKFFTFYFEKSMLYKDIFQSE